MATVTAAGKRLNYRNTAYWISVQIAELTTYNNAFWNEYYIATRVNKYL
jgi:hypothetical protein